MYCSDHPSVYLCGVNTFSIIQAMSFRVGSRHVDGASTPMAKFSSVTRSILSRRILSKRSIFTVSTVKSL